MSDTTKPAMHDDARRELLLQENGFELVQRVDPNDSAEVWWEVRYHDGRLRDEEATDEEIALWHSALSEYQRGREDGAREMTTLESQMARYEAVQRAPEHKEHTVLNHRVDTWKDKETESYIALIAEHMTQGRTEEEAVKAAASVIRALRLPQPEPKP